MRISVIGQVVPNTPHSIASGQISPRCCAKRHGGPQDRDHSLCSGCSCLLPDTGCPDAIQNGVSEKGYRSPKRQAEVPDYPYTPNKKNSPNKVGCQSEIGRKVPRSSAGTAEGKVSYSKG